MPTAYQWASKDEEQELQVCVYSEVIYFPLSNISKIRYEESGESTRVHEQDSIQCFCESFEQFLMNQTCTLASFTMFGGTSSEVGTRIYECVEFALKSRSEKLQVRSIRFEIFNTKQQIALLQLMNPLDMIHIYFKSVDIDEVSTFLENWNQSCRLELIFEPLALLTEDVVSVKKMLDYPSTFVRIGLKHIENKKRSKEQLILFFKPFKPYSAVFNCKSTLIYLKNPITKQIDGLSVQDTRSLEVFANPLLMGIIMEGIECFDIQRLCKVSRDIRSCIDTLKPDPHIVKYSIKQKTRNINPDTLEVAIWLRNNQTKLIKHRNREILQYEDDWHVDGFVACGGLLIQRVANDFKTLFRHQKSQMNELILDCDETLTELIGNVLKSRDTPLNCKELVMKVTSESDIMNILPYLNSVDRIEIQSFVNLYLTEVPNLDQWRSALALNLKYCTIMNSIQQLSLHNFELIDITVNNISSDDVIYLKEIATKSVKDIVFEVRYENSEIDDSLYTAFQPYRRDVKSNWYFPISIPEKYLEIELDEERAVLRFHQIGRWRVPEDFF